MGKLISATSAIAFLRIFFLIRRIHTRWKEKHPTGNIPVLRPPPWFRRWAPNIAREKLLPSPPPPPQKKNKKKKTAGNRTRNARVRIKHFTALPQRPVLFWYSIRLLYTYTLWLPSFDLLLSEDQTLIHRFLTSITMLQRQNDHEDDYNGLWLNGKIYHHSK